MDKLRCGHTTEHSSVKVVTTEIGTMDESHRRQSAYTLCFCFYELLEQVKLITEVRVRIVLTLLGLEAGDLNDVVLLDVSNCQEGFRLKLRISLFIPFIGFNCFN